VQPQATVLKPTGQKHQLLQPMPPVLKTAKILELTDAVAEEIVVEVKFPDEARAAAAAKSPPPVWHQRKKLLANVSCPTTVPAYNKNMQGVDCHGQLRIKIDLSSRHGFKKYYITHQLAQMDIGNTHACTYQFLANPQIKKKEGHRR
jgi:hypothetical protein